MNISYRIDGNCVQVKNERGSIRTIPRYHNIERLLQLENELEVIIKLRKENKTTRDEYFKKAKEKDMTTLPMIGEVKGCLSYINRINNWIALELLKRHEIEDITREVSKIEVGFLKQQEEVPLIPKIPSDDEISKQVSQLIMELPEWTDQSLELHKMIEDMYAMLLFEMTYQTKQEKEKARQKTLNFQ